MTRFSPPLRVGLVQMAPVLLDRGATLEAVQERLADAAQLSCRLVCFSEALVPGYPVWICRTDGARFDAADQKELHAWSMDQAVVPGAGHLDAVCALAREHAMAVVLGVIERATDRGGHSLYCARIYIDPSGAIASVHRNLMPTYEERLSWSPGDGHGLVVHALDRFRVGALNCWENWMPLARAALQAQGENVHVALWPGSEANTRDITRFIARESRSYVISVSGVLREEDLPADLPYRSRMAQPGEILLGGGSAVAGPDGEWVLPPVGDQAGLHCVELSLQRIYEERQNFDPSGHYARPDVLRLEINPERQRTLHPPRPDPATRGED